MSKTVSWRPLNLDGWNMVGSWKATREPRPNGNWTGFSVTARISEMRNVGEDGSGQFCDNS